MQVPGEQVGFLATFGAPDLDDHVASVVGVTREEQGTEFVFEGGDGGLEVGHLGPELLTFVAIGHLDELAGGDQIVVGGAQRTADGQDLLEFLEPATGGLQLFGIPDDLGVGQSLLGVRHLDLEGGDLVQHAGQGSGARTTTPVRRSALSPSRHPRRRWWPARPGGRRRVRRGPARRGWARR